TKRAVRSFTDRLEQNNINTDLDKLTKLICTSVRDVMRSSVLLCPQERKPSAVVGSVEHTLEERISMYRTAITNAKTAGESTKARRYERGLKTLQSMLSSVRKGGKINEAEIPPPVSCGVPDGPPRPPAPAAGAATPELESPEEHAESDSAPTKEMLLERQKEYRMAALKAKQAGDIEKAKMHIKAIDLTCYSSCVGVSAAPEAPVSQSGPVQPKTVLEALEQRMAKYKEACAQAKASGDDRKARMHDRIAKQYQSAIRSHKAGRPVNYDELPVPPVICQSCYLLEIITLASQQLEFLEGRKKQYMKAALQAKQKNDVEQAKIYLRTAKGLEPMIEAARSGKAVDISKVPSPPGDEDEDFILVHHSDVQSSEKAEEVYSQLSKLLQEQYEKCMTFSKQFTHTGNIAETTKFEKMAERCKKSLEILKLAQNRGLEPPKHHFEERTYRTVRIFPELSSTDMVIMVVRGMNLPAPHGVASNDLDAYVKFDFPYPSSDQPQKHKTAVVKNTNSPEYNQSFTLNINRNHRGFRRVVQSKGLKLEVFHKGGFLRSDKPVGTALIKLEKLETQSEVREIVEVMDGRKPTGGRLEVRVRLREPLSGQDLQTVTERWLVLDQS
uniref:Coiled-coil and C2 domain-containing protein 1B n=1 Tax=Pygocentrus nattereri TaxID=42514 RepID=A0AAR2KJB9_PYGNA